MSTSTKIQLSTLSYVIVYVKDTAKSTQFYRDILGMKVKVDSPEWVELETGAVTLALHAIEEGKPKPKAGNPELVFSIDNIYDAVDELKKAGVKFNSEPKQVCEEGDHVGVSATFTDEDGNTLSLYSHLHKDKVRK